MADIKAEYLACPIRNVVSRFGDKWSMLVLYQLHVSETGILRFNEMRRLMTDCSQKMLSQTLKNLEQSHLVHREVYPEVPPRVEYSLTDIGKSLMPTLTALIAWGKEHFRHKTKPEYGSNRHIQVKLVNGEVTVTNVHVGLLGDIITYPIDVDPELNISKVQLLDAILHELSSDGFSDSDESAFWDDFDNLQKAKIIR